MQLRAFVEASAHAGGRVEELRMAEANAVGMGKHPSGMRPCILHTPTGSGLKKRASEHRLCNFEKFTQHRNI